MATNELQLPPEVKESIEELEQELREGKTLHHFFFFHPKLACETCVSWSHLLARNMILAKGIGSQLGCSDCLGIGRE